MVTNVVLVLVLDLVVSVVVMRFFKVLKLFHFTTDIH